MGRRALNFDIDFDLDWKPEPVIDISEFQNNHSAGQSERIQSLLTPGISRTPYRGALTIIEYTTSVPQFEVIRDVDKFKMRFPFGGIETPDEQPVAGSRRESKEEVGLQLGKLTKDNFVGELSGGPNCTIFIFAKRLSAEDKRKVELGPEQKEHAAMLINTVDRSVERGLFSWNHANAWRLFKRWRVGRTY